MSSERSVPLCKVGGKVMNLIAEISAVVKRYIILEGSDGVIPCRTLV